MDRTMTWRERFNVDWWTVLTGVYHKQLAPKIDSENQMYKSASDALSTHRQWGGVDARFDPSVRADVLKRRPQHTPIYAHQPEDMEAAMPFDSKQMPTFIQESKARLDRASASKVPLHGMQCSYISLYAIPCSPFQRVFEAPVDAHARSMCMGFGDDSLLDMGSEGFNLKMMMSEDSSNERGPRYAREWRSNLRTGLRNSRVKSGTNNIGVRIANDSEFGPQINTLMPGKGFWKDGLLARSPADYRALQLCAIDRSTRRAKSAAMTEDELREVLVAMGRSNGMFLRGSKPMMDRKFAGHADFGKGFADDDAAEADEYAQQYPALDNVLAEAFNTMIAAATGLHPPVFAIMIARIDIPTLDPPERGIMLILTERAMNSLRTNEANDDSKSGLDMFPLYAGIRDPGSQRALFASNRANGNATNPNFFRSIVATHVGNRLSDLIFRSSYLGYLASDIKENNLVVMQPYRIDLPELVPPLHDKLNVHSNEYDFTWIPIDVMHIDCDARYSCFVPRSVQVYAGSDDEEPQFEFLFYPGSVKPPSDPQFGETGGSLILRASCLRLLMLFMTLLFSLCRAYEFDEADTPLKQQLQRVTMALLYNQLFEDVFGILRVQGGTPFGPLCTTIFTEEAWNGLFVRDWDVDPTLKNAMREEAKNGWSVVSSINTLASSGGTTWIGIAKVIKAQLHHYTIARAIEGRSKDRPGFTCPTKLFEDLAIGVSPDSRKRANANLKVVFGFTVSNTNERTWKSSMRDGFVAKLTKVLTKYTKDPAPLFQITEDFQADTVAAVNVKVECLVEDNADGDRVAQPLMEMINRLLTKATEEFIPFLGIRNILTTTVPRLETTGTPAAVAGQEPWQRIVVGKLSDAVNPNKEPGVAYPENMLLMLVGFLGYGVQALNKDLPEHIKARTFLA